MMILNKQFMVYCWKILESQSIVLKTGKWGNPLGAPPSLGALYSHFAITQ